MVGLTWVDDLVASDDYEATSGLLPRELTPEAEALMSEAAETAYAAVDQIRFDGMQFRRDIARKG